MYEIYKCVLYILSNCKRTELNSQCQSENKNRRVQRENIFVIVAIPHFILECLVRKTD